MSMNQSPSTSDGQDVVNTRIHGLLFNRKLTKKALTEALGLSQPTGSKKLNGHVAWSVPELLTVAHTLGTSVAYLIGEVDDDAPLRTARHPQRLSDADEEMVGRTGLEPVTDGL